MGGYSSVMAFLRRASSIAIYFFTSPRRTKSSCVQRVCSIMLFSVFRLNVLLPPWKTTVTLRS